MRAQEGVPAPLHLESSLQLGWNVLTVTKAVIDAAGNANPAAHIAESVFVVITSPSVYHHHGKLLSDFDFSNFPAPQAPLMPLHDPAVAGSDFGSDALMDIPAPARAVFEALAALGNRTIVSFGDSVERNIISAAYAICQHLTGAFRCMKMPDVAETGRALHVLWPSLGLNWLTISFPGVSYCAHGMSARLVRTQSAPQITRWVQPAFNFEGDCARTLMGSARESFACLLLKTFLHFCGSGSVCALALRHAALTRM
jgi:hypothetical protein